MERELIIQGLRDIVGDERVILEESTRKQKAVDLYALRLYQRHVGWGPVLPMLVVQPTNTGEISKLLKYCNYNEIKVLPYGGGSGVLAGAETIYEDTVIIDLSRLNQMEAINEDDLTITCGGGTFIKDLEAAVLEKGYILGHYPQSINLAQMGGLVSTTSIGQFSTGYGGIEDLLLGLEAVLPEGEIVSIKPNPRKSTGPDLKHLFIGSEGTLGIITKVTVKVFPEPEVRWKGSYRVKDMEAGLEIIRRIMRTGIKPSVVRLHDWLECEKPYGAFMEEGECLLIFLTEGREDITNVQGKIIEETTISSGGLAAGSKPVDIWFEHRNDAADEYEKYGAKGILVDTIEVSGLWSNIHKIYEETVERVYYEVPQVMYFSGHSSHSYINGTNIYFELGAFPEESVDDAKRIHTEVWDIVMEVTLKHGGSIAHHHGVGKHRAKYLPEELGSGMALLRGIKKAIDPKCIMNPGALLKEE